MADKGRQEDEIMAMGEIFGKDEFCYTKSSAGPNLVECTLSGSITLPEKMLKVRYINEHLIRRFQGMLFKRFFVRYLPSPKLHLTLPTTYPSQNPPSFRLDVIWLSPYETSKICTKLDDLWAENRGSEILFIWMNFLKFELLAFLNVQYFLDVSTLFTSFEEPDYYLRSDRFELADPRATNTNLFLDPKIYLTEYDTERHRMEFQKDVHTCKICYCEFSGDQCMEFKRCGHVCCKTCTETYISMKIKDGRVNAILCPENECNSEIMPDQVRLLVSHEMYWKYERLLLQVTLDSMNDIVYCPRVNCQCPVIRDGDETLATCANCRYSFCAYCKKVYHGIEPCAMTIDDQTNLIMEYTSASRQERKYLEKKHGRKQLQIIVEKHLTEKYLKESTKECPNCSTASVKIDGCNKMTCGHCQAHFCWLCGKRITETDPYDHFRRTENNPCYQRLFEGIEATDIFEDEIEVGDVVEEILL